jgi:hypothetical protein
MTSISNPKLPFAPIISPIRILRVFIGELKSFPRLRYPNVAVLEFFKAKFPHLDFHSFCMFSTTIQERQKSTTWGEMDVRSWPLPFPPMGTRQRQSP